MYAVQNPFLYGMYELRREQMKMQQESLEANLKTGTKVRFLKFYQVKNLGSPWLELLSYCKRGCHWQVFA